MKNFLKKNTGLLLRFDDVASNMNWKFMDKCEALFEEMNIKPLVGVIPDIGEIRTDPVSVCHHVSTISQLELPTIL